MDVRRDDWLAEYIPGQSKPMCDVINQLVNYPKRGNEGDWVTTAADSIRTSDIMLGEMLKRRIEKTEVDFARWAGNSRNGEKRQSNVKDLGWQREVWQWGSENWSGLCDNEGSTSDGETWESNSWGNGLWGRGKVVGKGTVVTVQKCGKNVVLGETTVEQLNMGNGEE